MKRRDAFLLPLLNTHQNQTRVGRDRLEILTALTGAPSFDPLYRDDIVQIPPGHQTYRWFCRVTDCQRATGLGDFCHAHRQEWLTAAKEGVSRSAFLSAAEPLSRTRRCTGLRWVGRRAEPCSGVRDLHGAGLSPAGGVAAATVSAARSHLSEGGFSRRCVHSGRIVARGPGRCQLHRPRPVPCVVRQGDRGLRARPAELARCEAVAASGNPVGVVHSYAAVASGPLGCHRAPHGGERLP